MLALVWVAEVLRVDVELVRVEVELVRVAAELVGVAAELGVREERVVEERVRGQSGVEAERVTGVGGTSRGGGGGVSSDSRDCWDRGAWLEVVVEEDEEGVGGRTGGGWTCAGDDELLPAPSTHPRPHIFSSLPPTSLLFFCD